MRVIEAERIAAAVKELWMEANFELPCDVLTALKRALSKERSQRAKETLQQIIENAGIAAKDRLPICQDTGFPVVFINIGEEVQIAGGLVQAIEKGIREGSGEGCLRPSVVGDPFERSNTGDNTPPVIHIEETAGNSIELLVVPRGAGSENMSRTGMLKPADGASGVTEFVLEVVKEGAAFACPPLVVGIGIGGTLEKAAILAKKAGVRTVGKGSSLPHIAQLETELLHRVNLLGIGPGGFGGDITALGVNIETYPCHIASLPVAVSLTCHACRRKGVKI